LLVIAAGFTATPAFAQTAQSKIDPADTAWMIGATGLVLMMTIPGLALFYAGMVRKKNVLATMAQSLAATFLVSLLWVFLAYSLAFTGEGAVIGSLQRAFMLGIGLNTTTSLAPTILESLFMMYQMTFAVITVALVAGSVADRLRFSAFLWFCVLWLFIVYVPIAHWVWGGGFLAHAGVIDFAGGLVVHVNAGVAGLVAALVLGKRRGYGHENLAPFDLSLAVIGTGLLWVGWFGFNGGSALGATPRCFCHRLHASCRLRRRVRLDGARVVDARQALRARHDFRGRRGARDDYAGVRVRDADGRHADRVDCRQHLLLVVHLAQAAAWL
jgi:ammonium transporter, Amt family